MIAARTDSNIADEAAGQARLELAAASRARTQAEAQALNVENAAQRREASGPRTDCNIEDEATGQARLELAAASRTRKSTEARELNAENAALRRRQHTSGPRTDNHIEDEAAGQHRIELAAASLAQRSEQNRQLAERNAQVRRRMREAQPRTDHCIDDEAIGAARKKIAAEAKARRAEYAQKLNQQNVEMQQRLKGMRSRTDHHKPKLKQRGAAVATAATQASAADEEASEVQSLRALFLNQDSRDVGNNSMRVPINERNASQRYLAASETKPRARGGWSSDPRVPAWDNRPHKPTPHGCQGMRPIFTHEPWTPAVRKAWAAHDRVDAEAVASSTFNRLDDGQYDSTAQLFNRRRREERDKAVVDPRPPWDSTQWKYVPPALKGLKTKTKEPWADDERLGGSSICWYSEEYGR